MTVCLFIPLFLPVYPPPHIYTKRASVDMNSEQSLFWPFWPLFPKFCETQNFSEKSGPITLLHLSSNIIQKIRKILRAVSETSVLCTDGRTKFKRALPLKWVSDERGILKNHKTPPPPSSPLI